MSFRFDRLATLYLARPLRAGLAVPGASVPILMYHSISETSETGVAPYFRVCTAPAIFAQQVSFLAEAGYKSLTLAEAQKALQSGVDLEKAVVITFDDGFRDFYTHAFPVLNRHGFSATMFLPTAYIAEERRSFKGRECLTWREVHEMRRAGMQFGSHTVNHPKLVELGWKEVEMELRDSKAEIEAKLGEAVETFAYPYAFPQANAEFSAGFRQRLQEAGYRFCVTTEVGCVRRGDDALRWKRLPANSCDDASLLEAKLSGAYDWLAWPQRAVKTMKATLGRAQSRSDARC
jgi:peptidoglycan/xylan/chitin deacetylase (PgdA/CDA1 family)